MSWNFCSFLRLAGLSRNVSCMCVTLVFVTLKLLQWDSSILCNEAIRVQGVNFTFLEAVGRRKLEFELGMKLDLMPRRVTLDGSDCFLAEIWLFLFERFRKGGWNHLQSKTYQAWPNLFLPWEEPSETFQQLLDSPNEWNLTYKLK